MAIVNSNVKDFLTKVAQGVKPNMFEVDIKFPTNVVGGKDGNELITMLCKSAALPASSVGTIEVPFRGRTVKIAGDRTFDNWTATFINDKEMKILIKETLLNYSILLVIVAMDIVQIYMFLRWRKIVLMVVKI